MRAAAATSLSPSTGRPNGSLFAFTVPRPLPVSGGFRAVNHARAMRTMHPDPKHFYFYIMAGHSQVCSTCLFEISPLSSPLLRAITQSLNSLRICFCSFFDPTQSSLIERGDVVWPFFFQAFRYCITSALWVNRCIVSCRS